MRDNTDFIMLAGLGFFYWFPTHGLILIAIGAAFQFLDKAFNKLPPAPSQNEALEAEVKKLSERIGNISLAVGLRQVSGNK